MPMAHSAGAVGASLRREESRRQMKKSSVTEDGRASGTGSRTSHVMDENAGRTSRASNKRKQSYLGDDSSRRHSTLFPTDTPDFPELLALSGGDNGASGGAAATGASSGVGRNGAASARMPLSMTISPPTPEHSSEEGEADRPGGGGVDVDRTPSATTEDDEEKNDGDVVVEEEGAFDKRQVVVVVDMSATGDWKGMSTLEKPYETEYDRPAKGWKTSAAKTIGFFIFFGVNAFLIAFLVPMVIKAMFGL